MTLYEEELARIQRDLKDLESSKEELDWAESLRPITDYISGSENGAHLNPKDNHFAQVAQELKDRGFVGKLHIDGRMPPFVSFDKEGQKFTYYVRSSNREDMAAYGNWSDDRCYTVRKNEVINNVCGDNARLAFEQGVL